MKEFSFSFFEVAAKTATIKVVNQLTNEVVERQFNSLSNESVVYKANDKLHLNLTKKEINHLISQLDTNKVAKINACYNNIVIQVK